MSKRTRGGSVTGGTGDIKPQTLTLSANAPGAADDYAVTQVNLPVPRFGTMKTKATVFELLHIDWYLQPVNAVDQAGSDFAYLATQQLRSNGDTSTLASFTEDLQDPTTFAAICKVYNFTTSGSDVRTLPDRINFTDDNGNGMIIATDRLFLHTGNTGGMNQGATIAKATYRLVNVGITEYVGIVQSQQG